MEDTIKTTADASGFSEFKAIRAGEKIPATPAETQVEPKKAETTAPASGEQSGDTVAPKQEPQEQENKEEKPKRDRTAEGRARELIAEGRIDEARNILEAAAEKRVQARIDKELQETRTRKPEDSTPAPKAEATAAPAEDPEPKAADPEFAGEDGYTKYIRKLALWDFRQDQRKIEAQNRTAQLRTSVQEKVAAARTKYADFDQVASNVGVGMDPESFQQFITDFDGALDVLHYLGTNPGEHQRILALPYYSRLGSLGVIAHTLQAPPEKPKVQPVSRVQAPPPKVGGTEAPEIRTTDKARNFSEFKQVKAARGA